MSVKLHICAKEILGGTSNSRAFVARGMVQLRLRCTCEPTKNIPLTQVEIISAIGAVEFCRDPINAGISRPPPGPFK